MGQIKNEKGENPGKVEQGVGGWDCEDAIDGRVGLCGASSGWVARRVSRAERTVSTEAWSWVQGKAVVMAGGGGVTGRSITACEPW